MDETRGTERRVTAEWLEANGLGGFASGTADGIRTRRYHALLLAATTPPAGRVALVNGCEVWIETRGGQFALTSHRYAPDVVHPDGASAIARFEADPWPAWDFALEDGSGVRHEVFVANGAPIVVLSWRRIAGTGPARLVVRPLLSGRDAHALHHENAAFRFDADEREGAIEWRPYDAWPAILARANGAYRHAPEWYRRFVYTEERARGLDDEEDLASPGVFEWDLAAGEATLVIAAATDEARELLAETGGAIETLRSRERARRLPLSRLERAAECYLVRRGNGRTIVAGYPWFCDWGRDTFIALRGLCLALGELDDARAILLEWAGTVSDGLLPNRFPEAGGAPDYNSVDASLWFVIAAHEYLLAAEAAKRADAPADRHTLHEVIAAILDRYAHGTRHGICMDADGLLAAGEPGIQLTWMDAKIGDHVVTPRVGKPVEVQALWLNALRIGARLSPRWLPIMERGLASFRERFWNAERDALYDVVDVDHRPGASDPTLRPNQIFAVGGLPFALVEGLRARAIVDTVERELWTPLGLRTLAPGEPDYAPRYEGSPAERDAAYHQGTVWPWLAGAFVEAWVRVHGGDTAAKREARTRFVEPLMRHLDEAGLGHVSEIADAEPPHTSRGCPFQAWSVGELLRLERVVLAEHEDAAAAAAGASAAGASGAGGAATGASAARGSASGEGPLTPARGS